MQDDNGELIIATIQTFGDIVHSFVERTNYYGFFMPGYRKHHLSEPINKVLPAPPFNKIDHAVGN